jgi:hypothetical protein
MPLQAAVQRRLHILRVHLQGLQEKPSIRSTKCRDQAIRPVLASSIKGDGLK